MRPAPITSGFVDSFVPSLGERTRKYIQRKSPPVAVIVHFTGTGPYARHIEQRDKFGDKSVFETAVRRYASVLLSAPHYVIGQNGEVSGMTSENRVAQHVGATGSRRYLAKTWAKAGNCAWWHERWPELDSPLDLADGEAWRMFSCNLNTIGIEVAPFSDMPVTRMWSNACLHSIKTLTQDICARNGIPWDKYHVFGHCDIHPLSRTKLGKPYDPFPRQWDFSMISCT